MGITESFKNMAEKLNGSEKDPDAAATAHDGKVDGVPDRADPHSTDNGRNPASDRLDTMPDGASDV